MKTETICGNLRNLRIEEHRLQQLATGSFKRQNRLRGCTKSLSVGHCGVETEYRNFTFPLFSIGCNIQK